MSLANQGPASKKVAKRNKQLGTYLWAARNHTVSEAGRLEPACPLFKVGTSAMES